MSIQRCAVTGAIAGSGDACGDCDPCIGPRDERTRIAALCEDATALLTGAQNAFAANDLVAYAHLIVCAQERLELAKQLSRMIER